MNGYPRHFIDNAMKTPQSIHSLGPVYEFVCISFRTDNLNCFRVS